MRHFNHESHEENLRKKKNSITYSFRCGFFYSNILFLCETPCSMQYSRRNSISSPSLEELKCLFGAIFANYLIRGYNGTNNHRETQSYLFLSYYIVGRKRKCYRRELRLRSTKGCLPPNECKNNRLNTPPNYSKL